MKAVIRKRGETIVEGTPINIDWNNGRPLTDPSWPGGPFTLVRNYVPETEYEQPIEEAPEEPVIEENEDDYVVINGVRYSKDELRSMLE